MHRVPGNWIFEMPTSTYVFDIETNGLLDVFDAVHCLVLFDIATEEIISCTDNDSKYHSIAYGLSLLRGADTIVGHTVLCFDIPALRTLFPQWQPPRNVIDTLLCSRLIWPNLRDTDFSYRRKNPSFPGALIGSHSLEAWGYRLRDKKDTFGKTTDWKNWSREMQEYCEQDVLVTQKLYSLILSKQYSQTALDLEHDFQKIIQRQEECGVAFDSAAAAELYAALVERREALNTPLQQAFPPIDKGAMFTPKVNNKTRGWTKGVPVWKPKVVEFNPNSRDHIAERLTSLGWVPTVFTDGGKPQIDDEVLSKLPYPEASLLSEYLMIQKRISQLAEGTNAWMKAVKPDGRIHGSVITNGAVTGRCTHLRPNLAQVPAVGVPYGRECRALFYAPEGYVMLGADASGLELRCLSHYLTKYDGGLYRDVVLHGDIHTENQKAAGLATRAEAKRFI